MITKFTSQYLPAIPLLFGIGIVFQLGVLSRFHSLSCFDWSQIPNDTTLLFLPLAALTLSYYSYSATSRLKNFVFAAIALAGTLIIVYGEYRNSLAEFISYAILIGFSLRAATVYGEKLIDRYLSGGSATLPVSEGVSASY